MERAGERLCWAAGAARNAGRFGRRHPSGEVAIRATEPWPGPGVSRKGGGGGRIVAFAFAVARGARKERQRGFFDVLTQVLYFHSRVSTLVSNPKQSNQAGKQATSQALSFSSARCQPCVFPSSPLGLFRFVTTTATAHPLHLLLVSTISSLMPFIKSSTPPASSLGSCVPEF